jgi:RNA polymerase sigma-70 factor (ECF subfamily)
VPATTQIEQLYRSHGPVVLRRARAILGSDTDAKEVLQDIFASLLARPDQFAGRGSPMMFLYRATTHRCLNQLRNRRNRLRLLETKHAPAAATTTGDGGPETRALVADVLRELPDDIAQAVVYYYVDEMTHAEIAAIMGCSRRHVGNLLARFSREHTHEEAPC